MFLSIDTVRSSIPDVITPQLRHSCNHKLGTSVSYGSLEIPDFQLRDREGADNGFTLELDVV